MKISIPSTIGLLSLSVAGVGCSDASKVASAFEKVCKEECECPDTLDDWNDVSNCKKACEGYALSLEAYIADNSETEPCSDLNSILKDLKRCTKNSCGDSRDMCLQAAYGDLYECWDFFGGSYYYYSPLREEPTDQVSAGELMQQMMSPIPGAIDAEQLHSAG